MACTATRIGDVTAIVCTRGRSTRCKACPCGRPATRLCDGRVPSLAGRTRRCDRPVCDAHATPVGVELDWCPECVAVDEARRTALRPVSLPDALVAYTDGSGSVAHKPSGAGVVLYDCALEIPAVIVEASVHLGLGSSQHAELSAARVALYVCRSRSLCDRELLVRTDSTYVIDALCGDVDPHPRAPNAEVIAAARRHAVARGRVWFEHVKGHTGEPGNERADVLAGLGRLRGGDEGVSAVAMPRAAVGGAR